MKSTGAQAAMGNRTGIQTSPELAEELIEGANSAAPSSEGGVEDIADVVKPVVSLTRTPST